MNEHIHQFITEIVENKPTNENSKLEIDANPMIQCSRTKADGSFNRLSKLVIIVSTKTPSSLHFELKI